MGGKRQRAKTSENKCEGAETQREGEQGLGGEDCRTETQTRIRDLEGTETHTQGEGDRPREANQKGTEPKRKRPGWGTETWSGEMILRLRRGAKTQKEGDRFRE